MIISVNKAYLTEIIILSLFFLNHCHSYIAVHFLEMFLLLVVNSLMLQQTTASCVRGLI